MCECERVSVGERVCGVVVCVVCECERECVCVRESVCV